MQAESRAHQGEMREGLRKVAMPCGARIVFSTQKAEIVSQRKQPVEHRICLGVPPLFLVGVSEPKAARKEDTKPTSGISSRLASSSGLSKHWVKVLRARS
jgi:hypothetical protein